MLLVVAPMDWITDCAYRILIKEIFEKYNKSDSLLMVTEFMSADGFVINPKWVSKHILHTEYENPLIVQIFGWNEDTLLETAKILDSRYDLYWIELNIWCPSPKIMCSGAWSGMMKDKKRTLEIIKNISQSIKIPFSIKTRSGIMDNDKYNQKEFIIEASNYCSLISVHWRTFSKWHTWEVDWEFIYDVKNKVNPNCKIIWNWWLKTYDDCIEKYWNLDWVMVWQSCIWNPFVFANHKPSDNELKNTILRHLDLSIATELYYKNEPFDWDWYLIQQSKSDLETVVRNLPKYDEKYLNMLKTPIEFRKHLFAYIKGVPWSKEFKQEIIYVKDYKWLRNRIERFFT